MSLDNISKSLGSVIDERLSNPLVSTFAISWSIINWKFFVVLFSDNTASTTIALVKHLCYPNWNEFWGWAVAAPISATLAYTYLLPYVSNPFLRDWRTNQQKVNGIKDMLPIEAVLTLKESLEIRKQQTELENTNNTLRTEVQGLRSQLFAAQEKVVERESTIASMSTDVSESRSIRNHAASVNAQLTSAQTFMAKQQRWLRSLIEVAKIDDPKLDDRFDQLQTYLTNSSSGIAAIGLSSAQQIRLQSVVVEAVCKYRNDVKSEATRINKEIVLTKLESGETTDTRGI